AVGTAMFIGMLISWAWLVPSWSMDPGLQSAAAGDLDALVGSAFRDKARIIGAGTIGIAAVWTLLKIIGPIVRGIVAAIAANRARRSGQGDGLALTERDLPITIVAGTIIASMIPIGLLLHN